jgi:hypothetical protein
MIRMFLTTAIALGAPSIAGAASGTSEQRAACAPNAQAVVAFEIHR